MGNALNKAGAEPKRYYSSRTIKRLFALSGNQCAAPNCNEPIIAPQSAKSDAMVVGQIAHIYAVSENGPRGKKGLTERDLNDASNLILLCPTHHVKVDGQHETYPASLLIDWKTRHERRYGDNLSLSISGVGAAEIEVAARALIALEPAGYATTLATLPPQQKIDRNQLGTATSMLLSMGAAKSAEVARVLLQAEQLYPEFSKRLSAGFVTRYQEAKQRGLSGDEVFSELYEAASGGGSEKMRQAAGLCIIAHLFIICDIFEK